MTPRAYLGYAGILESGKPPISSEASVVVGKPIIKLYTENVEVSPSNMLSDVQATNRAQLVQSGKTFVPAENYFGSSEGQLITPSSYENIPGFTQAEAPGSIISKAGESKFSIYSSTSGESHIFEIQPVKTTPVSGFETNNIPTSSVVDVGKYNEQLSRGKVSISPLKVSVSSPRLFGDVVSSNSTLPVESPVIIPVSSSDVTSSSVSPLISSPVSDSSVVSSLPDFSSVVSDISGSSGISDISSPISVPDSSNSLVSSPVSDSSIVSPLVSVGSITSSTSGISGPPPPSVTIVSPPPTLFPFQSEGKKYKLKQSVVFSPTGKKLRVHPLSSPEDIALTSTFAKRATSPGREKLREFKISRARGESAFPTYEQRSKKGRSFLKGFGGVRL